MADRPIVTRQARRTLISWSFTDGVGDPYDVSAWTGWTLQILQGKIAKVSDADGFFVDGHTVTKVYDDPDDPFFQLVAGTYRYDLRAIIPGDTLPTTIDAGEWAISPEGDELTPIHGEQTIAIGGTQVVVTFNGVVETGAFLRDGSRPMGGNVDMGTHNIENVGTVDGRDIAADGASLDDLSGGLAEHVGDTENPHQVTKADVGLGNVANALQATKVEFDAHAGAAAPHAGHAAKAGDAAQAFSVAPATAAAHAARKAAVDAVQTNLDTHAGSAANPHVVTKAQVGLGSADDTSDANKPVSIAQQAALDLKQALSEKGQAGGYAPLDGAGLLPSSHIPSIAISEYLGGLDGTADEAAMLALAGEKGDWTIRTDLGTVWVITGNDPGVLAGWTELSYPADAVQSVHGRTGPVTAEAGDYTKAQVGLGNVDNVQQATKTEFNAHAADAANPHGVTKLQVGLGNVDDLQQATKAEFNAHAADAANPHGVTKAQVGLTNVDDLQQATKAEFNAHAGNAANPHGVTKVQVGLDNVINVEQATKTEFDAHAGSSANPHGVTKSQVGLGNVADVLQAPKAGDAAQTFTVAPATDDAHAPQKTQVDAALDGKADISAARPPRKEVVAAAYTLILTDEGKHVEFNNANGVAVFIPEDVDVDFPLGTRIMIQWTGAGAVSVFTSGEAVLEAAANTLRQQFSVGFLYKRAANLWTLYGDLAVEATPATTLQWDGAEPSVEEGDQPVLAWTGTWTGHAIVRSRLLRSTGVPITDWDVSAAPWSAQTLEPYELAGWEEFVQAEYEDDEGNTIVTSAELSFVVQELEIAPVFEADVITLAHPTLDGSTQDFTSAKFSADNPVKAAVFLFSGTPTLGAIADNGILSVGLAINTAKFSATYNVRDNVPTTGTRAAANAFALHQMSAVNGSTIRHGTVQFLADGVRVTWVDVDAPQWQVSVLLLGGSKLENVALQTALLANNGATDVDFGFIPDALIGIGSGNPFDGTASTNAKYLLGVAARRAAVEQAAFGYAEQGGQNPSLARAGIFNERFLTRIRHNGNGSEVSVAVTSFDQGGLVRFTGTPGTNATDLNAAILALKFSADITAKVIGIEMPTAAGAFEATGFPGVPVAVIQFMSMLETRNTHVNGSSNAGTFGVGVIAAGAQFSAGFQSQNSVNPSNANSYADATPLGLNTDAAAAGFRGTLTDLIDGAIQYNVTTAPAAVKRWAALVISKPLV